MKNNENFEEFLNYLHRSLQGKKVIFDRPGTINEFIFEIVSMFEEDYNFENIKNELDFKDELIKLWILINKNHFNSNKEDILNLIQSCLQGFPLEIDSDDISLYYKLKKDLNKNV